MSVHTPSSGCTDWESWTVSSQQRTGLSQALHTTPRKHSSVLFGFCFGWASAAQAQRPGWLTCSICVSSNAAHCYHRTCVPARQWAQTKPSPYVSASKRRSCVICSDAKALLVLRTKSEARPHPTLGACAPVGCYLRSVAARVSWVRDLVRLPLLGCRRYSTCCQPWIPVQCALTVHLQPSKRLPLESAAAPRGPHLSR